MYRTRDVYENKSFSTHEFCIPQNANRVNSLSCSCAGYKCSTVSDSSSIHGHWIIEESEVGQLLLGGSKIWLRFPNSINYGWHGTNVKDQKIFHLVLNPSTSVTARQYFVHLELKFSSVSFKNLNNSIWNWKGRFLNDFLFGWLFLFQSSDWKKNGREKKENRYEAI